MIMVSTLQKVPPEQRGCDPPGKPANNESSTHGSQAEDRVLLSTEAAHDNSPPQKVHNCMCSKKWTSVIATYIHRPIIRFVQLLTSVSARNPRRTIVIAALISFVLASWGFFTNFHVENDKNVLWSPKNSLSSKLFDWAASQGYAGNEKGITLLFHNNGQNVLGREQVLRMFKAVDLIRGFESYDKVCPKPPMEMDPNCTIEGPVLFWNYAVETFEAQVASDQEVIEQMSQRHYPIGTPVRTDRIFGLTDRDEEDLLTSALSFFVHLELPPTSLSSVVEADAVNSILELADKWRAEEEPILSVEIATYRSFTDEYERAITEDIYLAFVVFIVMSTFTCLVFFKRHRVNSQILLGLSAVVSVLLSLLSGYGMLFLIGTPFTSITQLIPFLLFGIGLDDAFIITGSFSRTDHRMSAVERIHETMEDVGVSITVTTTTSAIAFGLGCISDIPTVKWLCLYSFPCIILVYMYQLTFFVACIVLDDKRIKEHRMDVLTWITVPVVEYDDEGISETESGGSLNSSEGNEPNMSAKGIKENSSEPLKSRVDQFMVCFAHFLLKPAVKVVVVLGFSTLAIICLLNAPKLRQGFEVTDVLPDDSYLSEFLHRRADSISGLSHIQTGVYFRNEDQSNYFVREQMKIFVDQLVQTEAASGPPDYFWLRDFEQFVNSSAFVQSLEFRDQVKSFLEMPLMRLLYQDDIQLDNNGTITSSRCFLNLYNVDDSNANIQVDALEELVRTAKRQPINSRKTDMSFFTFSSEYLYWEFFAILTDEMVFTTALTIACVTVLSMLLIPHWSAGLIVFAMISILYIDLLGVLYWAGLDIDPVSYITMAMSIGLMVDYIVHIMLRFLEVPGTRQEKTVETLRTMGSSVLLGGVSTFLGVVSLIFSTSKIFFTVFVVFLGLTTLGVSHGIVFLPVLLSILGTEECTRFQSSAEGAKDGTDIAGAENTVEGMENDFAETGEAGSANNMDSVTKRFVAMLLSARAEDFVRTRSIMEGTVKDLAKAGMDSINKKFVAVLLSALKTEDCIGTRSTTIVEGVGNRAEDGAAEGVTEGSEDGSTYSVEYC